MEAFLFSLLLYVVSVIISALFILASFALLNSSYCIEDKSLGIILIPGLNLLITGILFLKCLCRMRIVKAIFITFPRYIVNTSIKIIKL